METRKQGYCFIFLVETESKLDFSKKIWVVQLLNMRTWSERSTVWTQHISSGVQALIWWLRLGSSIEEAKGEIPEGKPLAGKGRLEPLGHVRKEKANLFICFASPE